MDTSITADTVYSDYYWTDDSRNAFREAVHAEALRHVMASDESQAELLFAVATGHEGKARASLGSSIVLVHRDDDGAIVHIRAAVAGKEVKADTWYSLTPAGDFVEASP